MQRVRDLIRLAAPTRLPVLIHGETGTGKELVATALHAESGRKGALVPFNVCAIPDAMFEASLFGHVRGAFTGAASDSTGLLREADGGSAFFDEVSGLPMAIQAKLLRVLETGVVRPVGASRDARSDFRILSATNESLRYLVECGRFRDDLSHRLSGIVIQIPALRERPADIPLLVNHFLSAFLPERRIKLDAAVLRGMMHREWRGNVRELRHVVEAAAVLGSDVIDMESYSLAISSRDCARPAAPICVSPRNRLLDELQRSDWDTRIVAERLGVHRATIYRWMRRLEVDVPTPGLSRALKQPADHPLANLHLFALDSHSVANLCE
jgi:DNA-binding NtrC family response regulator